jgi:hypothetical protein
MTKSPPKQRDIYKQPLRDEWGRWTAPDSGDVAHEVARILAENPQVFGDDPELLRTMQSIREMDTKFSKRGGEFFKVNNNAFITAADFTKIHVFDYFEKGRPSLTALAIHHADIMGLDKNSTDYKTLILIAFRAEMKTAVTPDYHNKFHYLDVAAMTANLLEKNAGMVKEKLAGVMPLTQHEQTLAFIAAIGHDLDHDGLSNPPQDMFFDEKKSFYMMEPVLRRAGLSPEDRDRICTILLTTSSDAIKDEQGKRWYGPTEVMRRIVLAQRAGEEIDLSKIDPANAFPVLCEKLVKDPHLAEICAIVTDADVAGSSISLTSSQEYSQRLASERKKAGENADLLSDQARKWFLDNIVGGSYFSQAAQVVADKSLQAVRRKTDQRIANASS